MMDLFIYLFLLYVLTLLFLFCLFWFVCLFPDDIRLELQNNSDIVDQLNTLATLAVNVSSCVSFNRIRAVKSLEELETMAKELFLKNELFASM